MQRCEDGRSFHLQVQVFQRNAIAVFQKKKSETKQQVQPFEASDITEHNHDQLPCSSVMLF
jgi:hypothetical protein